MKFIVDEMVFEKLENACFGVVIAKGIDNREPKLEIGKLLDQSIRLTEERFENKNIKEDGTILPYREAFEKLGINPNKFMSSIEAMTSRIAKKKGLPEINPIVDLGNAISLKYTVPMGAHDIDSAKGDIHVRFSNKDDKFTPFGQTEAEFLEEGELIYSVGDRVKTRRWIWRQSEEGKITKESRNIFFPIDGFLDKNYENVINARNELVELLKKFFGCDIQIGFVDKNNKEFDF